MFASKFEVSGSIQHRCCLRRKSAFLESRKISGRDRHFPKKISRTPYHDHCCRRELYSQSCTVLCQERLSFVSARCIGCCSRDDKSSLEWLTSQCWTLHWTTIKKPDQSLALLQGSHPSIHWMENFKDLRSQLGTSAYYSVFSFRFDSIPTVSRTTNMFLAQISLERLLLTWWGEISKTACKKWTYSSCILMQGRKFAWNLLKLCQRCMLKVAFLILFGLPRKLFSFSKI